MWTKPCLGDSDHYTSQPPCLGNVHLAIHLGH